MDVIEIKQVQIIQWEYMQAFHPADTYASLARWGAEGWELCAIDHGTWYFKRRKFTP